MKILSYNINRSTQEKIDKIMQFNADVFILPEVACPSQVKVPEGYRMEWMGNYDFKGLGVIWKSGMKAEIPQWYNPCHQYFLPIIIENKLIMVAWPTRTDDNAPKDYPQIAMETLQEYAPYLKEFPTVISGDMNCYKGQAGETKQYSIEAIFSFLEGMGYVSAYHQKTGELLGKESKTTYYHRFNENSPFFLDYTFSNVAFKSYALCEWNKEISDHVAQMMEL
jgi:exonuclease III